jgi:hypothetical protein
MNDQLLARLRWWQRAPVRRHLVRDSRVRHAGRASASLLTKIQ